MNIGVDTRHLADAALAELKDSASAFVKDLNDTQRQTVEDALRRLAALGINRLANLTNPSALTAIDADISHVFNTLQSEAALAQLKAEERVRSIISSVVTKAFDFAFKLI